MISGRKTRVPIQVPMSIGPTPASQPPPSLLLSPDSTHQLLGCSRRYIGEHSGSSSSRHHHRYPTIPSQRTLSSHQNYHEDTIEPNTSTDSSQPPLITDTLTACLDVNGTYLCTSYSPRCYIIQKVTPNSLRVSSSTSMSIGSDGHSSTGRRGLELSKTPSLEYRTSNACDKEGRINQLMSNGELPNHRKVNCLEGDGRNQGFSSNCMSYDYEVSTGGLPRDTVDSAGGRFSMGVVSQQQCSLNSSHYGNDTRNLNGGQDRDLAGFREETMTENEGMNRVREMTEGTSNNNLQSTGGELSIEELRQTILTQLEYYFSPDNLATDKFLVSQMDSDQYVYISTIANFNLIKKLSGDLELITNILRDSKHVQVHVDGKRVRPISNRTVVILRGIPESTPVEAIKALFERENSPRCNSCEFAFNDSWYLSFDSDEEATKAHRYLREEVREFKGQPIMARIKSRPTTLLGPGMVLNPKNGYQQPPLSTYVPSATYVPVTQTGSSTANAGTASMFPNPHQVSSTVFTMPQNHYGFGAQLPWSSGFYDLNPTLAPIYVNGLPSQNTHYHKSNPPQMLTRHRTSKSESESFNGPHSRGPRRGNGNSMAVDHGLMNGHMYPNSRKGSSSHGLTNNHLAGPTPLLAMPPPPPPLPAQSTNHSTATPHSQTQNSHNHHHSSNSLNRNATIHYGGLPPTHHVPLHTSDSFHRHYRSGPENRPRSSLGSRRGGGHPRSRDEEGNHEGNNPSSGQALSRLTPSVRSQQSSTTPQHQQTTIVPSQTPIQTLNKFDLEVSSFPPLPGTTNSASKNGDSAYEGRLSDVVKGVRNLKSIPSISSTEKEEVGRLCTEIVVSATGSENSTSAIYVVSAASPTREIECDTKERATSPLPMPSQVSSLPLYKKEYREVGVGSADDNHEIRASNANAELVVNGVRIKETADKSTQSVILKTTSTSTVPTMSNLTYEQTESKEIARKKSIRHDEESCCQRGKPPGGDSARREDEESKEGESPMRLSYAQVAQKKNGSAPVPPAGEKINIANPLSDEGKTRDVAGGGSKDLRQSKITTPHQSTTPRNAYATNSKRPSNYPSTNRRDRISSSGNRLYSYAGDGHNHKIEQKPN